MAGLSSCDRDLPFRHSLLRDYRNVPGLFVSCALNQWVFCESRALTTAGSNASAEAYILHETMAHGIFDYSICVGLYLPHPQNQCVVNENYSGLWRVRFNNSVNPFPLPLHSIVPSVIHHVIITIRSQKSDPSRRSMRLAESVDISGLRRHLRVQRFQNVQFMIRFIRYVVRILHKMYLDPTVFQIVQRIVREVHVIDIDSLVAITIYAKQFANDALKGRHIKQSFMRTLMRKHDFRIYICKSKIPTRLFPWVYSLIITIRKPVEKSYIRMHFVYYRVYVKLWIVPWRIRQITTRFLDVARALANDIGASFLAMVRVSANDCQITSFQVENVAFAGREDVLTELFNREPPTDFVYTVRPSTDRIDPTIPSVIGNRKASKKKKKVSKIREGFGGGGVGYSGHTLYGSDIKDYVLNNKDVHADDMYLLEMYVHENDLKTKMMEMPECIVAQVPIHILTNCITVSELREMADLHQVKLSS